MEDDLNFFKNGRRPIFFFKNGGRPQFFQKEDNLKKNLNQRRSKYFPFLLNSKPNPPILGQSTAQVMSFSLFFFSSRPRTFFAQKGLS